MGKAPSLPAELTLLLANNKQQPPEVKENILLDDCTIKADYYVLTEIDLISVSEKSSRNYSHNSPIYYE